MATGMERFLMHWLIFCDPEYKFKSKTVSLSKYRVCVNVTMLSGCLPHNCWLVLLLLGDTNCDHTQIQRQTYTNTNTISHKYEYA